MFLTFNGSSNFTAPNESSGCFLDRGAPSNFCQGHIHRYRSFYLRKCNHPVRPNLNFPDTSILFISTCSPSLQQYISLEAIYDLQEENHLLLGYNNTRPALMR